MAFKDCDCGRATSGPTEAMAMDAPAPMTFDDWESRQIDHWFTYHPPQRGQAEKYETLREAGRHVAKIIMMLAPPGADRSDAIRKVREAIFTANAAIACEGV